MVPSQPPWRPCRRLRHLQSLQARHLQLTSWLQREHWDTYFVVWSRSSPNGTACTSWPWLFTSPQEKGAVAPEWPRLQLSELGLDADLLHGPCSGLIHIHLVGPDLTGLEAPLPRNSLILELTDGLYIHPPLPKEEVPEVAAPASSQPGSYVDLPSQAPGTPVQGATQRMFQGLLRRTPAQQPLSRPSSEQDLATASSRLGGAVRLRLEQRLSGTASASVLNELAGLPISRPGSPMSSLAVERATPAPPRTCQVEAQELLVNIAELASRQAFLEQTTARRQQAEQRLAQALQDRKTRQFRSTQLREVQRTAANLKRQAQAQQQRLQRARHSGDLVRSILTAQASALLHSGRALQTAVERLHEAARLLEVEGRAGRLAGLHRHLVARRCRLATDLGRIFAVGPLTVCEVEAPEGGHLEERLERGWWQGSETASQAASSSSSSSPPAQLDTWASKTRRVAKLSIGGLALDALVVRRGLEGTLGWEGDRQEEIKVAAALGYVAAATARLADYLDVPLRYPIHAANSRSTILDHAPPAGYPRSLRLLGSTSAAPPVRAMYLLQKMERGYSQGNAGLPPIEFPLYYEGSERTRFAYGIFLLSKDIEQLLNAHGLSAVGPSHVLQNLYKLLAAAASALPPSASMHRPF
ncbi:hypothetical protein WJX72_004606 [[Myrmecia] bisecta]|uniref:UV radiation resistance-associated gene protein n=1 Tax=[Myrmecia] bisecta TaxID=41462 RepID=A0AAW1P2Q8_9CHLO